MNDQRTIWNSYCKNCGHESHCGTDLYKEFKEVIDNKPGIIKVCSGCSCDDCNKTN